MSEQVYLKLICWNFSAMNPQNNVTRSKKWHENQLLYTLFNLFFNWCDRCYFRHAKCAEFWKKAEIFSDSFWLKSCAKSKTFRLKNFYLAWPALRCHTGDIRRGNCEKLTLFSEETGVAKYFRQKLAGEKLSSTEISGHVQLRHFLSWAVRKQIIQLRSYKFSVKPKKRIGHWGISNLISIVENFEKVREFFALYWRIVAEKKLRKKFFQHTAQLNGVLAYCSKILAFPRDRTQR